MPEPIVSLNEESLKSDLREPVGRAVEDTLNGLPGEEADDLVGAERHGRTAEREACRAGHYDRSPAASSGEVTIHMPKLKGMRFATAIIERYRRRETGVEEAVIEMCLAGVPTRRIEDASEIPWGSSVSAATVSDPNERASASVEERRNRPLERAYPYVCVDGIYLTRSRGGSYENVAVTVAIGVNDGGCREVVGAAEGYTESPGRRRGFLPRLRSRGLRGVRMFTGGKAAGMVGPVAGVLPGAACQGRTVRFHRNAPARVPKPKRPGAAAMPKAVHAMESREAAEAKALGVASELEAPRLGEAAKVAREGSAETLAYTRFPREHRRRIRTDNAIERPNREIRRRTRVVGTFPDGRSAPMLVTARLKYVAESEWGSRRYLDVTLLDEWRAGAGLSGCRKVRKNLDGTRALHRVLRLRARQQEDGGPRAHRLLDHGQHQRRPLRHSPRRQPADELPLHARLGRHDRERRTCDLRQGQRHRRRVVEDCRVRLADSRRRTAAGQRTTAGSAGGVERWPRPRFCGADPQRDTDARKKKASACPERPERLDCAAKPGFVLGRKPPSKPPC